MKKSKKILIITVLMVNLIYIIVRFFSIPISHGVCSFILGFSLFMAEFLGFMAFCIYVYAFTGEKKIQKRSLKDLNGNIPTVDVFICTFNESIDLLTTTIMAAKNLKYPKDKFKVYVLDDGNRNELKNLCESFFNVNYITRTKNINAKAGNINNALMQTSGELFTVLDADMICKPNYLEETVRLFFKQ